MDHKKTKIIVLVIACIVFLGAVGFYFYQQSRISPAVPENTAQDKGGKEGDEGTNNQTVAEQPTDVAQPQRKVMSNEFSIDLPASWEQTEPPAGIAMMAVHADEQVDDPAAQKIGFKSYFAVSHDALNGKSVDEYLGVVKSDLEQGIPNIVFSEVQTMTFQDRSARVIEAELTQQEVNFKVLIAVLEGKGDDVWGMSFNTPKSSWDEYKALFYNLAGSFTLN